MMLNEAIKRYTSNAEYERTHGNLQGCLEFKQLAEWLEELKQLKEQEPCEDAISREEAIDYLWSAINDCQDGDSVDPCWIKELLEELPSVQPEITRCKECKHRDKYGCCKYWKGLAMVDISVATDDNDFCSYAERI